MTLFDNLSKVSRRHKLNLFYKLLSPARQCKVLDVGAGVNPDG
jgi:hypothetical protein